MLHMPHLQCSALIPTADCYLLRKALLGLLFGLLIGGERALRRRPRTVPPGAIIRTLSFVGLGCSLAVGAFDPPQPQVAAGVLTGIAFLGTGIILKDETSSAVTGVTSAASIFFLAALGACVGVGRLWTGTILAGLAIIVLEAEDLGLRSIEHRRSSRRPSVPPPLSTDPPSEQSAAKEAPPGEQQPGASLNEPEAGPR